MKREFRCHPLMIFRFITPFLVFLTLPVIKALINYLTEGKTGSFLLWEAVFGLAVLFISIGEWRNYKISVDDTQITVNSGFIVKKQAQICLDDISSVEVTRNIADRIFRAVTYEINTEAGGKVKADFVFKLSLSDSRKLSQLLYGKSGKISVKFSFLKLAVMSATTSSVITGIIVSVPVIKRAGDLLGIALDEMLIDRISKTATDVQNYFPPIVNAITIGVSLFYFVAFCYSLLKYINFKLKSDAEKISVAHGFFTRKKTVFKRKAVNNIVLEQTPLMRFFGLFSISASVGGFGGSRKETATVIPCVKKGKTQEFVTLLFPFASEQGNVVSAEKSRRNYNRFLFKPLVFTGCVIGAVVAAVSVFEYFDRFMLFLMFISLALILYYANLCIYNFKNSCFCVGEQSVTARGICGFKSKEIRCRKDKIGEIKTIRYPADRRYGTCKVKLTVRSESAQRVRVLHLDYRKTQEIISEVYNK